MDGYEKLAFGNSVIMNIILLTNYDFASLVALNLLMPRLNDHQLLIGLSDKVGGNQKRPRALTELAHFENELIKTIVRATHPLLLSDLNQRFSAKEIGSFEKISHQYQTEIVQLSNINQSSDIVRVKNFKPDVILSIRFGKILQQPVIDIPRYGIINLHSGMLPEYQGVMATFWAMLNGAQSIGTSLHFISDSNIDNGEIILESKMPLEKDKSYLHNVIALYHSGCQNMLSAVNRLQNGQPLISYPQQGKACYYGFPTEQDLDKFYQMGFQLFNEKEFV